MSDELDTTIRIIELVTQTGIYAIRLSKDCSLKVFEKLQDIYHAGVLSKAGKMNYEKLIKHVGRDTVILDFHIEDNDALEKLKQGLTEYKVSFVQLPDMEVGDGRTQFMIDASDAAKVNGYLKAHMDVKVEPITANDYTNMGSKERWDEIHEKACKRVQRTSDAKTMPVPTEKVEKKVVSEDIISRESKDKSIIESKKITQSIPAKRKYSR